MSSSGHEPVMTRLRRAAKGRPRMTARRRASLVAGAAAASRVLLCLLVATALTSTLAGCSPRMLAGDAATAGESPRVNNATSAPVKDVPYCPGGNRASDCLFGANCRVTNDGCQVCQCLSP